MDVKIVAKMSVVSFFVFISNISSKLHDCIIQGVQQPGKPEQPRNVREFESGPKQSRKSQEIWRKKCKSGKSQGILRKSASQGKVKEFWKCQVVDQSVLYFYSFPDC